MTFRNPRWEDGHRVLDMRLADTTVVVHALWCQGCLNASTRRTHIRKLYRARRK